MQPHNSAPGPPPAGHGSPTALTPGLRRGRRDGDGPVAKGAARDQVREEMPMLPLVLSSDSHVFEPPDLWQTRIDAPFRDRAPRRISISTSAGVRYSRDRCSLLRCY